MKLMNKIIALRISDVRNAVDSIQSAADLKKAADKIDNLKKLVD